MKKICFWFCAMGIVAVYFLICYYVSPRISLYVDTNPLSFSLMHLAGVLTTTFTLFLMFEGTKFSFKKIWREDKPSLFVAFFIVVLVIIVVVLFSLIDTDLSILFDYPLVVLIVPLNFFFIFVVYKLFRWAYFSREITQSLEEQKPMVPVQKQAIIVEDDLPLMPILWIGPTDHPIPVRVLVPVYKDNVVLWDYASAYSPWREIKNSGILVTLYSSSSVWRNALMYAKSLGIPVIIVVKAKNYRTLDKLYKERFLIYKIENNMGFTMRIKDLIEQHGRRKER